MAPNTSQAHINLRTKPTSFSLITAAVLLTLLASPASSTTAYVDYSYTGTPQLDSESNPYPTISSALEALSAMLEPAFLFPNMWLFNNLDSQIIIKNGAVANYSLANYIGNFQSWDLGSTLTISYESQTNVSDVDSCLVNLPIIEIHETTELAFTLESIVIKNVVFAFMITAGDLTQQLQLVLTPIFQVTGTSSLTVSNTCFFESGSVFDFNGAKLASSGTLEMDAIVFQRATMQGYYLDAPIQIYKNLSIIVQQVTRTTQDYLIINSNGLPTYNVSMNSITMTFVPSGSSITPGAVFIVATGYLLDITQMSISNCQLTLPAASDYGVFNSAAQNMNITDLVLNNVTLIGTQSIYGMFFLIILDTSSTYVYQSVQITNSQLTYSYPFAIVAARGAAMHLQDFIIVNNTMSSSSLVSIQSASRELDFRANNFTLKTNTLVSAGIVLYTHGTTTLTGTIFNVINLTSWSVSANNFTSGGIFNTQYPFSTGWENEKARVLVTNVSFSKNVISSVTVASTVGLFVLNSIYARFDRMAISNNQFLQGTGFVVAPTYPPNLVISNSAVQSNLFQGANVVNLNMSELAFTQLSTTASSARLLKVVIIYSTHFTGNYLYSAELIRSSNPQVYIVGCDFGKTNFITNSQLIVLGHIDQPSNFPYFARNTTEENLIFEQDPQVLGIFNRAPSPQWSYSSMASYEYIIGSNTFQNTIADTLMTLFTVADFHLTGSQVIFVQNTIEGIVATRNDQALCYFEKLNALNVYENTFRSINVSSSIISLLNFQGDQNLRVSLNSFYRIQATLVLECASSSFSAPIFRNNQYTNLKLARSLFALSFSVSQSLLIDNDEISGIILNPFIKSNEALAIYDFQFHLPNPTSRNIEFNSVRITNVEYTEYYDIYVDFLPKALFVLSVSTYNITITNSSISSSQLLNGNLFVVSANEFDIVSSNFTSLTSKSNVGFTYLYVETLVVENCSWSQLTGSSIEEGGIFTIQQKSTQSSVTIHFFNTNFESIFSYRGPIINSNNKRLSLKVENCVFTQNTASVAGLMYFNNTVFTGFTFENNLVRLNASISALVVPNFLLFSSCSLASTDVQQPTIFNTTFDIIGGIPFTAFTILLSRTFNVSIDTVSIVEPGTTFLGVRSVTTKLDFQLLSLDGSFVYLSSLSAVVPSTIYQKNFIEIYCETAVLTSLVVFNASMENALFSSTLVASTTSIYSSFLNIIPSSSFCGHTISVVSSSFSNIGFSGFGSLVLDGQNIGSFSDIVQNATLIQLINSNFSTIQATFGSVAQFYGIAGSTELVVDGCQFFNNYAGYFGGVVFYIDSTISIQNSIFDSNVAGVYGNVLFSQSGTFDLASILTSNDVSNQVNSDPISIYSSFSRYPNSLQFIFKDASILQETPILVLDNITSYSFRSMEFEVRLVYDTGSEYILVSDPSSEASLYFTFHLLSSNQSAASESCAGGVCSITGLAVDIEGKRGNAFTAQVEYVSTYYFQSQKFQVLIRDCIPGEIRSVDGLQCTLCEPGTYSFSPNETSCKSCPTGAICPGGAIVYLEAGYWAETAYSDSPVLCNDSSDARRCLGGSQGGNCAEGFIGPACYQCDYKNNWYSTSSGKCAYCISGSWPIIGPVLYFVGYFILQIFIMVSAYKENLQIHTLIKNGGKAEVKPASFIRLLTTYSQIVGVISQMQEEITSFLGVGLLVSNPYGQSYFSLSCALLNLGYSAFTIERIQVVIALLSPLAKTAFILTFIALYKVIRWMFKKNTTFKMRYISAVVLSVLILLEQPSIVGNLSSFFTCDEIVPGSGQTFLQRNRAISCQTDQYRFFRNYVVISGFVLWGALVPLCIFLILFQWRQTLNHRKFLRLSFGSLYNECQAKRYYWGVVIMILKLLVYIANSLLQVNTQTKAMTLAQIFVVYWILLSISGNPYVDEDLFQCEKVAFLAYFVTMFYTVYFINGSTTGIKVVSLIFIASVNLFFIVKIGIKLAVLYFGIAKNAFQKMRRFWRKVNSNSPVNRLKKLRKEIRDSPNFKTHVSLHRNVSPRAGLYVDGLNPNSAQTFADAIKMHTEEKTSSRNLKQDRVNLEQNCVTQEQLAHKEIEENGINIPVNDTEIHLQMKNHNENASNSFEHPANEESAIGKHSKLSIKIDTSENVSGTPPNNISEENYQQKQDKEAGGVELAIMEKTKESD